MRIKLLFILCFLYHAGRTQQKVGYLLNSEVVRIPFEMVNQSMFVKVKLNEHRNLSFLVDTGSSFSVVFTDSLLQIPTQYKISAIRGFGKLDSIPAQVSAYNTLSMGALTSFGHQMLVVEKDKVGFQQFFDQPLHGIIGFDVLKNFDLEINFVTNKLILRKNSGMKKQNKKWVTIPFSISNNAMLVTAEITSNQQIHSLKLILDTGSELPLLLSEKYCPPNSHKTIIGLGFLGYASGWISTIDNLSVGGIKLTKLTASFPDSTSVTWNPKLPQQGNLGIQFLKRFRVFINFHEQYLQLRPVHKFLHEQPKFNRSGMAVMSRSNKICAYTVDEIVPGSPADKGGMLKGDRILSMKDTQCKDLTLQRINDYLFSEDPSLRIEVFRNNALKVIVLDLRGQK